MTERGGNNRDATYLASQMVTNARVLALQTRMERARDRLHQMLLEVTEEAGILERPRRTPSNGAIPALDRTTSTPRVLARVSVTPVPPPTAESQRPASTVYLFGRKALTPGDG